MGQWRPNLTNKQRRNSRRPKTLVIETTGSVGINPPGFVPMAKLDVTAALESGVVGTIVGGTLPEEQPKFLNAHPSPDSFLLPGKTEQPK